MDRIEQQDAAIDALLDAQEIYEQIGMYLQALQQSFQKTPVSTPITFHVEEDCFMDNGNERLQMKRLTINDLENM